MSQQYIVVNTEQDAIDVNAKMSEQINCPIVGNYRGQPDPNKQQTTSYAEPLQINNGSQLGKWVVMDVKDRWFTSQMKSEFTRWLNQNIQGYAREPYNTDWFV